MLIPKVMLLQLELEYGKNWDDTSQFFTNGEKLFFTLSDNDTGLTFYGANKRRYGGKLKKLHPCFKDKTGQIIYTVELNGVASYKVQPTPVVYNNRVYAKLKRI